MRVLLLLALVACSFLAAAAAPVCPTLPVQLELRATDPLRGRYALAFAAIDPAQTRDHIAEFVDIHYRINNEDSLNHRVLTEAALTEDNLRARQAVIEGIEMRPGDVLRAYATYSSRGVACETPIHTFSAPEQIDSDMMYAANDINSFRSIRNTGRPELTRGIYAQTDMRTAGMGSGRPMRTIMRQQQRPISAFYASQAAEVDSQSAMCPSIPFATDVIKVAELSDSYVVSFENRSPLKQLHFVDLHLSVDPQQGWDNLRLASDMQLTHAHKVMQPGVVIRPDQVLQYYWSYRTTDADGQVVDCTTPLQRISPQEVSHEITLQNLQAAALWE